MNSKTSIQKIGTDSSHRKALVANLSVSLITHEHMQTTISKAKATIPFMDRLLSIAKGADRSARSKVSAMIKNQKAADKIFDVLVPRFKDETSGFIQMYKLGKRKGDSSEIVRLVLKGYELPKTKSRIKESKKTEEKAEKSENKDTKESKGLFGGKLPFGKKQSQVSTSDKSKAKSRSGI